MDIKKRIANRARSKKTMDLEMVFYFAIVSLIISLAFFLSLSHTPKTEINIESVYVYTSGAPDSVIPEVPGMLKSTLEVPGPSYASYETTVVDEELPISEDPEPLLPEEVIPEEPVEEPEPEPTAMEILEASIGQDVIEVDGHTLVRYDLPGEYYPGLDYSYFQPFEDYRCITNKTSMAYWVTRGDEAYTDEKGFRRYETSDDWFTLDGQESDYVVALGTYYKPKGICGTRYLVVTSTGMYTCITGDEKDDRDTDSMNMFSWHCGGEAAGVIEWLVDKRTLAHDIKVMGTVTYSDNVALQGEILDIYKID